MGNADVLHQDELDCLENILINQMKNLTFKTELCQKWIEKNSCKYGKKCKFAHGRNELNRKICSKKNYKLRDCATFFKTGYCRYGVRCNFKHEERKVEEIAQHSYYFRLLKSLHLYEKLQYNEVDQFQIPALQELHVSNKHHALKKENAILFTSKAFSIARIQ